MSAQAEYHITIKDLPASERPRERLLKHGAHALSTPELLAILLRTGTRGENSIAVGQRLLKEYGGLTGLARADAGQLQLANGLGDAKIAQLKAALEIGRRLADETRGDPHQIRSPADAANPLLGEMSLLEQEEVRVILLDTKNRVLDAKPIYKGSLNSSMIRVGELFKDALRQNSAAMIVVHNHPSGDPTPSPEDVSVTRQIVDAGKLLDVDVLDHLIIGDRRFISLKERGLGFG